MDGWRTTPPPSGDVPCDEGVEWLLEQSRNTTITEAIVKLVRAAENPNDPLTRKEVAGWIQWQLEVSEVQQDEILEVVYVMALARLLHNNPMRIFRLWLRTPRRLLTDKQEKTLVSRFAGKVPRAERMVESGRLQRAR